MKKLYKINFFVKEIVFQNFVIKFDVFNRSSRNIIVKVKEYNYIEISVPKGVKKKHIEDLIDNNIEEILRQNDNLKEKKLELSSGDFIFFLGEKLEVILEKGENFIEKDEFEIRIYKDESTSAKNILKEFYKNQLLIILEKRVRYFCELMNVNVNKIYVKDVKTFWGSCSGKRNITFNYKLCMFDFYAIDYIIVHELAHLIEMNHSKKFWLIVEKYCADYKAVRKRVKASEFITSKF